MTTTTLADVVTALKAAGYDAREWHGDRGAHRVYLGQLPGNVAGRCGHKLWCEIYDDGDLVFDQATQWLQGPVKDYIEEICEALKAAGIAADYIS